MRGKQEETKATRIEGLWNPHQTDNGVEEHEMLLGDVPLHHQGGLGGSDGGNEGGRRRGGSIFRGCPKGICTKRGGAADEASMGGP